MSKVPACWGHRGASADYPENTIASFESAARAGSAGIESDVHITSDGYILMFHDPELGRTTRGGEGHINALPYKNNIELLRTIKTPEQKIPTFDETVAWLMKSENRHMVLNIDVKANNDPERLFELMHNIISVHESWETDLAPRLILGLWHPKFIQPAMNILPRLKRCFIGILLDLAESPIIFDNVDAFSIGFPMLCSPEGAKFRERVRKEGKELYVWTLNRQEEWVESAQWQVDVVMTDKPDAYMAVRQTIKESASTIPFTDPFWKWKDYRYYAAARWFWGGVMRKRLEQIGGPLAPYLMQSVTA